MLTVVLAVAGVLLLGFAVWLRLGRTEAARSWVGEEHYERTALVTLPMVALVCLAVAVVRWADDPATETLADAVVALAVILFLLYRPAGRSLPDWSVPGWYRARTAHRSRRDDDRPDA